ncbi:LysR family transcriptional regulator [Acetobacteraceae bacterium]|nr:LysR family transcriptional regulator [Acetobacteraceae bacterium]
MTKDKWSGIEEVVALNKAGSFSGAAKLLGVSTSNISRTIANLEARLGIVLFLRNTRKVSPTPEGKALIERFHDIIHERDEIIASISTSETPAGIIKLTCPIIMGERIILPICMKFADKYPQISFDISFENKVINLIENSVNLAIRTGNLPDSGLIAFRIASRPLRLCASPDYFKRHAKPKSLEDLTQHRCIQTGGNWRFNDKGEEFIFKPQGDWKLNSGNAVLEAALNGKGICQLPSFYVNKDISIGNLEAILEEFSPPAEPIWGVLPHKHHIPKRVHLFIEMLKTEMPHFLNAQKEKYSPS